MIQGGAPNVNAETYWKNAAFSYKFFCLSSTLIFIFSLVIPFIAVALIDIPELTVWSFQIWRLIFSVYGQLPQLMSLINLIFAFIWLYYVLNDSEASTVYKIFEVLIINLEIHLVFNILSLVFTFIFETQKMGIFFGYGWFPVIIVYQFRKSAQDPEGQRRFCCFPFLIKNRYYPWVLLFFLALFSTQLFCFVACGILGYYQQIIRKQMIIKLPMCFYLKFQQCLPDSVKRRSDFVMITDVTANLARKCWKSSQNDDQHQVNSNPFSSSPQQPNIVTASKGEKIGGGAATKDFRNYWAQKQQKQQQKNTQEIQIEPQVQNQRHPVDENDSYAVLSDNHPPTKGLLEQQQSQYTKGTKKTKNSQNDLI